MFERTKDLLRRLTGSLEESDIATEDEEMDRRAWPRYATDLQTVCRLVTDHETLPARIRNVSRVGINLLIHKRVEPGDMLQIDLPNRNGHPETVVLACVMHTSNQPEGQFSIGCMFSEELGEEELREFGGQRERAAITDKRAWVRFPAKGHAYYHPLPDRGQGHKSSDILNISPAGIGLLTEERIEPGVVLNLELRHKQSEPLNILACVVYLSERREGGWLVGCNFIRELEQHEIEDLV